MTTIQTARTPEQSARSLFTDVGSTAGAIERGDWLDAGIGATGTAMDIVGLRGDPLAALSSAGVGWVLNSVSFLREPFDALLGDPGAIQSSARTWQRAAGDLASVAQQYRDASAQQTQRWTGAAGDGYRSASAAQATGLEAISRASTGVAQAIDSAGRVLAQVRKTVLDLIGDAVGKIIQICVEALARAGLTNGASIALGIAQSVRTATQTARKLASEIQKLVSSMQQVIEIVRKLLNATKAVKELLDMIGGKAIGGQPRQLSGTQVGTLPDSVPPARQTAETLLHLAQSAPWTDRLPGDYPPYGTIPSQRQLSPEQLRKKTDEYLFDLPLHTFTQRRNQQPPLYAGQLRWDSDGCSYSPDRPLGYNFTPACDRHDFGYRNYADQGRLTEANRARIDAQFRRDLNDICDASDGIRLNDSGFACAAARDVYHAAVRQFGGRAR